MDGIGKLRAFDPIGFTPPKGRKGHSVPAPQHWCDKIPTLVSFGAEGPLHQCTGNEKMVGSDNNCFKKACVEFMTCRNCSIGNPPLICSILRTQLFPLEAVLCPMCSFMLTGTTPTLEGLF